MPSDQPSRSGTTTLSSTCSAWPPRAASGSDCQNPIVPTTCVPFSCPAPDSSGSEIGRIPRTSFVNLSATSHVTRRRGKRSPKVMVEASLDTWAPVGTPVGGSGGESDGEQRTHRDGEPSGQPAWRSSVSILAQRGSGDRFPVRGG